MWTLWHLEVTFILEVWHPFYLKSGFWDGSGLQVTKCMMFASNVGHYLKVLQPIDLHMLSC